MEKLPLGLLDAARNYLDITWEDFDGDQKLRGILLRGMAYIDRIAGRKQDYTAEGKAKELLLDYARYVRSNKLEDFAKNYLSEIIALQVDEEVERYAAGRDADV